MTTPTPKKKSGLSSPQLSEVNDMQSMAGSFTKTSVRDEDLSRMTNKMVKVFLLTGATISGRLLAYDAKSLRVSHELPGADPVLINYDNVCTVLPIV